MDEREVKRRIRKIREAYNRRQVDSIEFDDDGSGIEVFYTDPVGDHGCPCQMYSALSAEYAIELLAGMRLKIADIPTTVEIEK